MRNTTKRLFRPGHKELNLLGSFTDTIFSANKSVQKDIYVVRGLTRCLLGRPIIEILHLVKRVNEVFTPETVKQNFPRVV